MTLPGPKPGRYWGNADFNALRQGILDVSGSVSTISSGAVSLSVSAASNTTQGSSGVIPASSVVFAGAGIVSVGVTGGSVVISVPAGGGAGDGYNILAAGGSTAGTAATIVLSNASGVSFGLSGSTITASVRTDYQSSGAYLTTAMASDAGSRFAGTAGAITGGSITVNTSGVSVHVPAFTGPSVAIAASSSTAVNGTVSFANSNGITFGITASTFAPLNQIITASHNGLTTAALSTANVYASGGTFGTSSGTYDARSLSIAGSGAVSVAASNSGWVISAPVQSVQPVAASASNGSFNFSTLKFVEGSGVTWATQAGGIQASVQTNYQSAGAYLTTAAGVSHTHGAGPTLTGPIAATSASNGLSLNVNAIGATTAQTNVTWTVGTGGLSLNAAGYAGTVTGATGGSITANSSGISINIPAGGGGFAIPDWENLNRQSINLITNATATGVTQRPWFFPIQIEGSLTANFWQIAVSRPLAGANVFTIYGGLYTISNSTKIVRLASFQNAYSQTSTVIGSSIKRVQITGLEAAGTTLTPGRYIAMLAFSGTAGTSGYNMSIMGEATVNPPNGIIGGGTNAITTANLSSIPLEQWQGLFTATSGAPPASVHRSDLQYWTTVQKPYLYMGSS